MTGLVEAGAHRLVVMSCLAWVGGQTALCSQMSPIPSLIHTLPSPCSSRSLFEKDKLLFAFLLSARIMLGQGSLDASQHQFLLTGTGAGGGDRGDLSGRGEGGEQPGRRWQG